MSYRQTPKHLIVGPVKHYNGQIWDAETNHVCDIRGWGRLQYFEHGEALQDKIGDYIAAAINEKLEKEPLDSFLLEGDKKE